MLKSFIFFLIISCCASVEAQIDSAARLPYSPVKVRLFYISSLIYPGINAGTEFSLIHLNEKLLQDKKRNKYLRERFISGNMSWYHHSGFHDNIFITAEWVMRRTKKSGFITEFSAGPGFSRTFLTGTTYKVADNGSISIDRLAGYNYALIKVGGGLGFDYSLKKNLPISSIAKISVISMFPYNSTVYFRPVLEIGVVYKVHLHDKRSNNLTK